MTPAKSVPATKKANQTTREPRVASQSNKRKKAAAELDAAKARKTTIHARAKGPLLEVAQRSVVVHGTKTKPGKAHVEKEGETSGREHTGPREPLPEVEPEEQAKILEEWSRMNVEMTCRRRRQIRDGTAFYEQERLEDERFRSRSLEPLERSLTIHRGPKPPLDPMEYPEIQDGTFLPEIRIRNMVFTMIASESYFNLLEIVHNNEDTCSYNPAIFAALRTSIRSPKATLLTFSSGRVVVTGMQHIEQCNDMRERMPEIFRKYLSLDVTFSNFGIQNIVAPVQCCYPDGRPFALDVAAFAAQRSCEASYEGDRFPGAIWRDPETKVMFLAFKTGALVMTGAKDQETLHRALRYFFYNCCIGHAVSSTTANTSSVYSNTRRRTGEDFYNSVRTITMNNPTQRSFLVQDDEYESEDGDGDGDEVESPARRPFGPPRASEEFWEYMHRLAHGTDTDDGGDVEGYQRFFTDDFLRRAKVQGGVRLDTLLGEEV